MAVEKRGKKWAYRFNLDGETHFKGGFKTATEAESAEAKARLVLSDTMTFTKMAKTRLEHVQAYCTKQHLIDTRAIIRRFSEWADTPLVLITKEMIANKILGLAQELSPNNVNRHIRGLKSLFELAVEQGFLPRNPMHGIKFLPVSKTARVVPTPQDIKEVLLRANPEEQAFLTVIWQTAARVSEINHLAWEDVDFDQRTIRLWTRKSKGGNRMPRVVTMLPDVEKALLFMHKNRVKDSPWVFTSHEKRNKYPDEPDKWYYGYRSKLLKRLTSKFRYHALRHSTASTLAAIGVELPAIQKILGHSRPTTTDLYLSTMPGGVKEGMNKLGEFLGGTYVIHNTNRN